MNQDVPNNTRRALIVAGAVAWTNAEAIARELARFPVTDVVIHGDAPGADALAGQMARERGMPVLAMKKEPGDYRQFGRAAWKGLNERMMAERPHQVLVFHHDVPNAKGSQHLMELAKKAEVPVACFAD